MSKTDGILDVMGWRLATRPRPQLYVGPSKDFVGEQFEPRLMKLFDEAEKLAALVGRGKKNKKTRKTVNGVSVRLAWAGSATSLASDQAGDVYIDEYDKMIGGVKGEGDPFTLAKARADTYSDRKIVVTSTPKRGTVETERDEATGLEFWKVTDKENIESPIWAKWQTGTRHHWAWKCPHCGDWFVPRFSLLKCDEGATPTQARRKTWLEAPCGCVIEEKHKAEMNAGGDFIAPGMTINKRGEIGGEPFDNLNFSLWVSGLASPFVTWGERMEETLNADAIGDSESRQGARNKTGEVWSPISGDVPDWQAIVNRAEPYPLLTADTRGEYRLPEGVLRLSMGVDVQSDRLMVVIRGWGMRATSWLIQFTPLYGETSETKVWRDLAEMLTTPIDGLPIHLCFVDSGFRPGKKIALPLNRVYQFCRRFKRNVRPTKGSSHAMLRPITKIRPDVNRKADVDKYGLELLRLDTDYWKSFVHERLSWPIEEVGAWHLGTGVTEDYARQLVAEQRIITDDGKAEWIERNRNNHYLDCEAMAAAAGFMMNVHHIKSAGLRRPPERTKVPAEEVEPAPVAGDAPPMPTAAIAKRAGKLDRFAKMAQMLNRRQGEE